MMRHTMRRGDASAMGRRPASVSSLHRGPILSFVFQVLAVVLAAGPMSVGGHGPDVDQHLLIDDRGASEYMWAAGVAWTQPTYISRMRRRNTVLDREL